MKKVLVIMGATGTGKTDLAMRVADLIPSQIISIDSAMVYQGMDIGTAKPTRGELLAYPHELVDVLSPVDSFSVADCVSLVPKLIAKAHSLNKLPILVGGTMMYHYVLQNGMHVFPEINPEIKSAIQAQYKEQGLEAQWRKLQEEDPVYATKLFEADKQRIHRALELLASGIRPSEALSQTQPKSVLSDYNLFNVCLECLPRSDLYAKLDARFDQMIAAGFVAEVDNLLQLYPDLIDSASFRSIGYRQIAQHVLGNMTIDQVVVEAKTATRRFAKRQVTWANRWHNSATFVQFSCDLPSVVLEKLLEKGW